MSTIADPPDPAAQERVQRETVDAGLAGSYPDAVEIQARIQAGRIAVQEAPQLSDPFEEVLEIYGLQEGDKAVVRLAVQVRDVEATVTDDRLLSFVLQRCGRQACFLPDFIERSRCWPPAHLAECASNRKRGAPSCGTAAIQARGNRP